jgi:hypothetical protein
MKTQRRSIAIEQVTRSRPFHVPPSQAHSVLKFKSRISFSSRFEFLSFHTAWVIRDWVKTTADQAISGIPRSLPALAMQPKIVMCQATLFGKGRI